MRVCGFVLHLVQAIYGLNVSLIVSDCVKNKNVLLGM